jgi:hypothetical protein
LLSQMRVIYVRYMFRRLIPKSSIELATMQATRP